MANEGFLHAVSELLIKVQAFVVRPNVQIQLVAILAILVGVGFLSGIVIVALNNLQKRISLPTDGNTGEISSRRRLFQRMFESGAKLLVFPILALIASNIVIFLLQAVDLAIRAPHTFGIHQIGIENPSLHADFDFQ